MSTKKLLLGVKVKNPMEKCMEKKSQNQLQWKI